MCVAFSIWVLRGGRSGARRGVICARLHLGHRGGQGRETGMGHDAPMSLKPHHTHYNITQSFMPSSTLQQLLSPEQLSQFPLLNTK